MYTITMSATMPARHMRNRNRESIAAEGPRTAGAYFHQMIDKRLDARYALYINQLIDYQEETYGSNDTR
jgi:hypothetical protein